MGNHVFPEGSRVCVVSYSPFRGLKGTIRTVHRIALVDEPFCYYQVELEGAQVKESIWTGEIIQGETPGDGLLIQRLRLLRYGM